MCAPSGPPNPLRTRCEARKALHQSTPPRDTVVIRGTGEAAAFFAVLAAVVAFIAVLAAVAAAIS